MEKLILMLNCRGWKISVINSQKAEKSKNVTSNTVNLSFHPVMSQPKRVKMTKNDIICHVLVYIRYIYNTLRLYPFFKMINQYNILCEIFIQPKKELYTKQRIG